MAGYDRSGSSPFQFRSTRARLAWDELCRRVRALVAQTNREAGESVLWDDVTTPATALVIQLQDGHGFKAVFDPKLNRVRCEFPRSPQFNRTLELAARVESPQGKGVWTDLRTGASVSHDEIAGDLVRNLLIMTNDY